jgi:imidazolonepropionase-like amidohydrolase
MTRSLAPILGLLAAAGAFAAEPEYDYSPAVYALTDARVVASPGQVLEHATVVLRDGIIEAVGTDVSAPDDAVLVDCKGLTVYPGLIDARTNVLQPQAAAAPAGSGEQDRPSKPEEEKPASGYGHRLTVVRPENRAADLLVVQDTELEKWRAAGFTTVLSVPRGKLILGKSALLDLAGASVGELLVRTEVALHINFQTDRARFPASMMGAVAVIRQSLHDASHYALELARYRQLGGRRVRRPAFNAALEALVPAADGQLPVIFDAPQWLDALRALRIAQEFGLTPVLAGVRDAYRIVPQLQSAGATVILGLDFPKAPDYGDPNAAADADRDSLQDLRDRARSPDSAAELSRHGVHFALTAFGLDSPADLSKRVATAIERGLPRDVALGALTIEPARLLGVDSMLGTIAPGKVANLIVTDGELFDAKTKVRLVFVDGHRLEVEEKPAGADANAKIELAGTWEISVDSPQGNVPATLHFHGSGGNYSGDALAMGMTIHWSSVEVEGNSVTLTADGSSVGMHGQIVFHVIVAGDSLSGSVSLPNGESASVRGNRTSGPQEGQAP